jgi:ankyrin repeat protein
LQTFIHIPSGFADYKCMKCKPVFRALSGIIALCLALSGCNTPPSSPDSEPTEVPIEDDFWSLVERGEIEKARELFKGKIDVHATGAGGRTPLHAAAEIGDSGLASFLITMGAEVDALDNEGRTPLSISTGKQDPGVAGVLAAAGADIHRPINGTSSAALVAVSGGGAFLSALLNPVTLDKTDASLRSILHLAALNGKVESVNTILGAGAKAALKDSGGKNALDLAFTRPDSSDHMEAAERLILAGSYSVNPIFPNFAPAVRTSNYNIRFADGSTPLHFAAREGYTGLISFLLKKKADTQVKNGSGTTPLHEAARSGKTEAMRMLIAAGAEVNVQDAKGNTPLHIAIPPENHQEAISLLLSNKADPNLRDVHGESPLHIALTLNRSPEIAQALLAGGSDVSMRNMDGKTPLYLAVEEDRINCIPILLAYGSDIFAADNEGITPFEKALLTNSPILPSLITTETVHQTDSGGNTILHLAIKNRADTKTIGLILDQKANVNARNNEGNNSLHLAVRLNQRESGELLISRGADIFAANAKNESPLYLAFISGGLIYSQTDARRWMINSQTLEARDGLGNSVLHYAAQWKLDSYIPFIIQQGANTEAANATGETPLFEAVKQNSSSTVQVLLGAGSSLNARDYLGNSALHAAVRWNAKNAAQALLDAGIDINAQALSGKTPLHDAVRLGIVDLETLLVYSGAELEIRDSEGNTPFMEAVLAGYPQSMERLADLGADPTTRNARGDTPIHIAVAMERSDLTTLLLRWGSSIHAKNSMDLTPFQTALVTSPRMVSTLLTKDRLNAADDSGSSPLHIAVLNTAPVTMVKTILDLGGRISSVDSEGRSPLRVAVDQNAWEHAKLLADAGADPFSVAGDEKTPADIALLKGSEGVAALFSGRGINARDASGNTILHYAARYGNRDIISELMELGANKAIKNIAQESPADIAWRWNHGDAAHILN